MRRHTRHSFASFVATSLVGIVAFGMLACSKPAPKDPCYVGPIKQEENPVDPGPFHPDRTPRPDTVKTATPIKHVVFIMKENRTFDHLFGAFPGANGAATGMADDTEVDLRAHCFPQVLPRDIKHDYAAALMNWNNGEMNGFGRNAYTREWAYTQATEKDIPNYWHWAERYALSDNFFASVLGPSFPNHLYSLGGTTAGTRNNPKSDGNGEIGPNMPTTKSWGCDAPADTRVGVYPKQAPPAVLDERYPPKFVYPCFKHPVLPDRLMEKDVTWAYYGAEGSQEGYFWVSPDYIDHIRNERTWETHVFPVDQVVDDIEHDRLPSVTWITPMFWQSDHAMGSICLGENWTTQVVNAIMESPMWEDTVIFVSWDDWGGFYDHVPPPVDPETGNPLGFRVPLLTISPYAKPGFIDSEQGDFTSVLRFIEHNWDLRPLEMDVPTDNDLMHNFDFSQTPLAPEVRPMRTDCQGYPEATENKVDPN